MTGSVQVGVGAVSNLEILAAGGTGGRVGAPTGALKESLSMIADIIVEDMLRVERELGIKPQAFAAYYEERRQTNREGGQQE
jgi:hypothetical protein